MVSSSSSDDISGLGTQGVGAFRGGAGSGWGGVGGRPSLSPSLDLQFATDKTLTARKGPTPVFTRASGATQVGASGLIEFAPENLYGGSQDFSNVSWNRTNITLTSGISDALGGSNAFKLTENTATGAHSLALAVTPTTIPHTMSIYAKKGERSWVVLRLGAVNTFFNLDAGTFVASANPASISNAGNGWYRCSVTSSAGTQGSFLMATDSTTTSYTGDGTSGLFLFGAQLERFDSARTYIPTTTAAVYGARFDHDPITLACKGLLIEESRTNLCTQSANLTAWSGGFTISGSTTAPDGTSGSYLAAIGTTNCQTLLTANVTGLHTMSVFLKRNTTDWVRIQGVQGANLHSVNLWVNLATGAIGTLAIAAGTPTSLSAQVTPAGNGWYRCSVTASYPATSYLNLNVISATADASTTRVAGSIYGVWGAQIEAGAFPTSYIPTTTASVVRSADICSITGAAFTNLWNTAGGTFLFDGVLPSAPTLNNRLLLSSGGVRRWLYGNNAGQGGSTESLTAFDGVTTPSYFTNVRLTTRFKIAISVEALSCRASFNGSSVTSISHNGALLNSVTLLALCEGGAGTITGVKYYRKNLSNQKLQAITA